MLKKNHEIEGLFHNIKEKNYIALDKANFRKSHTSRMLRGNPKRLINLLIDRNTFVSNSLAKKINGKKIFRNGKSAKKNFMITPSSAQQDNKEKVKK